MKEDRSKLKNNQNLSWYLCPPKKTLFQQNWDSMGVLQSHILVLQFTSVSRENNALEFKGAPCSPAYNSEAKTMTTW